MFYNHVFYNFLRDAYRVTISRDGLRVRRRKAAEPEDVSFALMSVEDARAALRFIGERIERFYDAIGVDMDE